MDAKTLRETTRADYRGGRKLYLKEFAGPLDDWEVEIASAPVIALSVMPAYEKCDRNSLIAVGLSSVSNGRDFVDICNYSRFDKDRLRAEVLLDSVSQVTGVEEKFEAMPPGLSASEFVFKH